MDPSECNGLIRDAFRPARTSKRIRTLEMEKEVLKAAAFLARESKEAVTDAYRLVTAETANYPMSR